MARIARGKDAEDSDPLVFVQRFADGIPTPVFYKDSAGIYRVCNRAYEKLVGRPRKDILGRATRDIFPPETAAEHERRDRELWVSGRVQSYDMPFRAADGSPRRGLCRKSLIHDASGAPKGLIGIVTDVTDLLQAQEALARSEEWFRLLTERALDVIAVIDAEGLIRFVTPAVERVLGWTPAQLVGGSFFAYIHPEDAKAAQEGVARSLARTSGDAQLVLLRFRCRDDSWKTLEVIGNNRLADPAVEGIIVNARDVTLRVAAELKARQSVAVASRLLATRILARGVARHIDRLVSVTSGNASLLSAGSGDADGKASLAEILRSAHKAGELARQLSACAQESSVPPRPTNVNESIREAVDLAGESVLRPGLHVELALDAKLARVQSDPTEIMQLVSYLLANAVEAIPAEGRIVLRTRTITLPGGVESPPRGLGPGVYVGLTVEDSGTGIDSQTARRIFEPFFTTKPDGLGLGLSAVRGIVDRLGGAMTVASKPGAGATFAVFLPALPGEGPDTVAAPAEERSTGPRP